MGTEMGASISLLTQCTCENDNCVVTCAPLCAGHKVEPLDLNCCSLPLADWDVALISSHGQPDFKHNHISFVEGQNKKRDKYLPSKVPTVFVFLLLCYLNWCTLTLPAWFPIMLCGVGLCWLSRSRSQKSRTHTEWIPSFMTHILPNLTLKTLFQGNVQCCSTML